jgi:hypothetical protein
MRVVLRLLALGLALLAATPAGAQRARTIYAPDDPDLERALRVERLLQIYLVEPPRRHASERVRFKKGRVVISAWHPVARETDAVLKTRAVQWLLFGRTRLAQGARGVFSELPRVEEIVLALHEVIRPERKGRRKSAQPDRVKPYLVLRLSRRRFEQMALEPLRACVEREDCSAEFRTAFDDARYKARFVARRRAAAE